MSPTAVTDRLTLVDELWELSVELMRAKPLQSDATLVNEQSLAAKSNPPEASGARQDVTTLSEQ